jgi:hypothetical protein
MFSEFHILDGGLGSELLRHGIPVHVCRYYILIKIGRAPLLCIIIYKVAIRTLYNNFYPLSSNNFIFTLSNARQFYSSVGEHWCSMSGYSL